MTEWFQRWFGEEYLAVYPHRDEAEAEQLIELLARHGVGVAGQAVLDLACGAGRHACALAGRGARVTGYDLSHPLLLAARTRYAGALIRGDMRSLALAAGSFDAVVNLFTSFGYFADDSEHEQVLREVARVLRPGGRFAFDFLNAPRVRATLVSRDERSVGGRTVVQERELTPDLRYVIKNIHVREGDGLTFSERVRLLERDEVERMFKGAALAVRAVMGGYDGSAWSADSERLIIVAERE